MADRLRNAGERSIEVLSVRPDLAAITTTAQARINDGTVCTVSVGDHALTLDLPHGAGGLDTGPSPSETLAAALAACLAQGYMAKAALIGADLTAIEVKVEGDFDARGMYGIDPEIPSGFQGFRYEAVVESPESEELIAEIHETAVHLSPLLDDLTRSLEIDGTWRRSSDSEPIIHP